MRSQLDSSSCRSGDVGGFTSGLIAGLLFAIFAAFFTVQAGLLSVSDAAATELPQVSSTDVNLTFHFEGVFSSEDRAAFSFAVERTLEAFPNLDRPENITAVAFSDPEFLSVSLGRQFRDDWVASNGAGVPEFYGGGIAWGSLSTFAVQAEPSMFSDENVLRAVFHETYHLLQLHGVSDVSALPLAVVEGSARFAESFVVNYGVGDVAALKSSLSARWGGESSRRASCFLSSSETDVDFAVEVEKFRLLGCDSSKPGSQRAVRASLDGPVTFENYTEWAGFLYWWTFDQGFEPSSFLTDLWSAVESSSFETAWAETFDVPYGEFESWVAGQVAADRQAWDALQGREDVNLP